MVGGYKHVKKCLNCPRHVQEEVKAYLEKKQNLKAQQQMEQARFQMYEPDEYDDVDEEDVVKIGNSRKKPPPKNLGKKALWTHTTPLIRMKSSKVGKEGDNIQSMNFKVMVEAIGQFGPEMKPPSMYELRVPLLKNEVQDVNIQILEHEQEWAEKVVQYYLMDGVIQ
uniref:Uncharacterized protein n=1 Tax=Lactuca sativa TaxID=4236 RepID=A0A9R1XGZ0_LACSA|nr:hypothetical protein LSAT_V11C400161280 [Lactuca sativa]